MKDQLNVDLLPGWKVVRRLGSGSYGKVYEVQKTSSLGGGNRSALKVISIPPSADDYAYYEDSGYADASITEMFQQQISKVDSEFKILEQLKGNSHIVSYEDHDVIAREDGRGWDIFIRMELLTALPDYLKKTPVTEELTIKLGIDLCLALELCQKHGIIHRDIKPKNIFVNNDGYFKLGDFGIAKVSTQMTRGTARMGTYTYMAPEVYYGKPYHESVDIYSLGLVLYWLMNERKMPFIPRDGAIPTADELQAAQDKRLVGESLPPPCHGSRRLKETILRACFWSAEDRYKTAKELRLHLEEALRCLNQEEMDEGHPYLLEQDQTTAQDDSLDEEDLTVSIFAASMDQQARELRERREIELEQEEERERLAQALREQEERERLLREQQEQEERARLAQEAKEKADRERLLREQQEQEERARLAREAKEQAERERLEKDLRAREEGIRREREAQEEKERQTAETMRRREEAEALKQERKNRQAQQPPTAKLKYIAIAAVVSLLIILAIFLLVKKSDKTSQNGGMLPFEEALLAATESGFLQYTNAGLEDITALQNYPKMKVLDLSGNKIQDISALNFLTDLTEVNLANNQIEQFTEVDWGMMPRLRILDMSGNALQDIDVYAEPVEPGSFGGMRALEILHMQNCSLSEVDGLTLLYTAAPQLKELHLQGNPELSREEVNVLRRDFYRAVEGMGSRASLEIYSDYNLADSLSFGQLKLGLTKGQSIPLAVQVSPADADGTLYWSIEDGNVAMVDLNGTLTALAAGTTTITATMDNRVAGLEITVIDPPAAPAQTNTVTTNTGKNTQTGKKPSTSNYAQKPTQQTPSYTVPPVAPTPTETKPTETKPKKDYGETTKGLDSDP